MSVRDLAVVPKILLQVASIFVVLESYLQMCVRFLSDRDMGQLGYFLPTLHSLPEYTPEEVDWHSIKKLHTSFRQSVLFRKRLSLAELEKMSDDSLAERGRTSH